MKNTNRTHAELMIDELVARLEVANDWLADKGIDPNHIEMRRIREAIARAKAFQAVRS